MKIEFFLTEVAEDWTENNLLAVQEALRDAELATLSRSDKIADPLLDTPNHPNIRGYLRWVLVQKHLEIAAKSGKFDGITATWINLGGVNMLELHGKHTVVTPIASFGLQKSIRENLFIDATAALKTRFARCYLGWIYQAKCSLRNPHFTFFWFMGVGMRISPISVPTQIRTTGPFLERCLTTSCANRYSSQLSIPNRLRSLRLFSSRLSRRRVQAR